MKYFEWFIRFIIFISFLVTTIFALFLFITGIKLVYSELQLINETLTNGVILTIIGGGVLIFWFQIIKNITLKDD
jgi:hypothetical protein